MRIIELFAGIGACSKALDKLEIEHEIVDAVEIDKYAIKSFNAIHNTNFEVQDITKWDKDFKDIDLIMHGSPCQDFSVAGNQAGGDLGSGTRSSLMYETIRIVGKIRPKYVIWENVKNLLSAKHKHNFDKYIETLTMLGYNSYYQVLNAKYYGMPQNRERVYTISIRQDVDNKDFAFPEKIPLKLRLRDFLDNYVDDKYYLSENMLNYVLDKNNVQKGTKWEGRADNDLLNPNIAHALSVRGAGGNQRAGVSNFIIDNFEEEIKVKDVKRIYGIFDNENKKHQAGSVYDSNGLAPTLDTMQGGWRQPCIEEKNGKIRIRKLTPRECWRLMGFSDYDIEKAKRARISDTQLYKQAGNSIVVNVLEEIFKVLFKEEMKDE